MNRRFIKSPLTLGADAEQYFDNSSPDPAGSLIAAGEYHLDAWNDWWDNRGLRSYPYFSLIMMLEGSGGFYRDESGYQCQLSYGDFMLIYPGYKQHHAPGKDDRWGILHTSFAGPLFDLYRNRGILNPAYPVWRLKNPLVWQNRLRRLLRSTRPTSELEVTRESIRFLHLLLDMLSAANSAIPEPASSDWFSRARVMLGSDLSHRVDMPKIAATFGMSYHTFRLHFATRAGMPPLRFREQQRIKAASGFLINSEKTCQVIATSLGYANGNHFSAQFKRYTGMAPSAYRKKMRGKKK